MSFLFRRALVEDHRAFTRLFAELGVDDPVPDADLFAAEILPNTIVAERAGEVVGYVYFQTLAGDGYVRHVVVAPEARGKGLGRELMDRVAEDLRRAGVRRWRLNVRMNNVPAVRLYEGLGMRASHRAVALRFTWALVDALGPELLEGGPSVAADVLDPSADALFEDRFDVPRGLLAARRTQRFIVMALREAGAPVGVAAFSPSFPGAIPFRVARPSLAGPLLASLRPFALPDVAAMQVVTEADQALTDALLHAGAKIRLDLMHYVGEL